MTRKGQARTRPVKARATSHQSYVYGWVFAVIQLSYWRHHFQGWNDVMTYLWILWYVSTGIAALSVRPWAWYLLVGGHSAWLVQGVVRYSAGYWRAAATADSLSARLYIAGAWVFALTWAALTIVYFYRRRAMFGAARRWLALERRWPGLAGPELYVGKPRGFLGLSSRGRVLFVGFMLALNLLLYLVSRLAAH